MSEVSKCSVDGCEHPPRGPVCDPTAHVCRQCEEHCQIVAYVARTATAAIQRAQDAEVAQ